MQLYLCHTDTDPPLCEFYQKHPPTLGKNGTGGPSNRNMRPGFFAASGGGKLYATEGMSIAEVQDEQASRWSLNMDENGTYKITQMKFGKSWSKPPFLSSMLIFFRVNHTPYIHCNHILYNYYNLIACWKMELVLQILHFLEKVRFGVSTVSTLNRQPPKPLWNAFF